MLPAVDFIRHEVFSSFYFIFFYPSTVNLSTLIRLIPPPSLSLSLPKYKLILVRMKFHLLPIRTSLDKCTKLNSILEKFIGMESSRG